MSASAAGARVDATSLEEADTEHGDRRAGVKDPFGNVWWLATPKPTLT